MVMVLVLSQIIIILCNVAKTGADRQMDANNVVRSTWMTKEKRNREGWNEEAVELGQRREGGWCLRSRAE